jgi:hypothetical protein
MELEQPVFTACTKPRGVTMAEGRQLSTSACCNQACTSRCEANASVAATVKERGMSHAAADSRVCYKDDCQGEVQDAKDASLICAPQRATTESGEAAWHHSSAQLGTLCS